VGNEITRDDVIRGSVGLYPGQVVDYREIKKAEARLTKLGIFECDKATGIHPRIVVLDGDKDSIYKDILIQVKEISTRRWRCRLALSFDGIIAFELTLKDRNFDPLRFPHCLDDFWSGRAFGGGGVSVNLTLLRVPLLPHRLWSVSAWRAFLPSEWNLYTSPDPSLARNGHEKAMKAN